MLSDLVVDLAGAGTQDYRPHLAQVPFQPIERVPEVGAPESATHEVRAHGFLFGGLAARSLRLDRGDGPPVLDRLVFCLAEQPGGGELQLHAVNDAAIAGLRVLHATNIGGHGQA